MEGQHGHMLLFRDHDFVAVVFQDRPDDTIADFRALERQAAGVFQTLASKPFFQAQQADTAVVGLLGKRFGIQQTVEHLLGIGADLATVFNEVVRSPALLEQVGTVRFRHVGLDGRVAIANQISAVHGNALVFVEHLDGIVVIDQLDLFADILVRHAVLVPVFAKDHMIVFF